MLTLAEPVSQEQLSAGGPAHQRHVPGARRRAGIDTLTEQVDALEQDILQPDRR